VNRLQTRLLLLFLAATAAPVAVTLWITTSLLERSLEQASTRELDVVSKSLEKTGRELYQRTREALKQEAAAGRVAPQRHPASGRGEWPAELRDFWESGEPERFVLAGQTGERLEYLVRREGEVWAYESPLGVGLAELSEQYRRARSRVELHQGRDWLRGFTYTYVVLAAAVWTVSLTILILLARRFTRPIQELTAGLQRLAEGHLETRVPVRRNDEVGQASRAFNHMAGQLEHSRSRLIYLTQLASWQALARKMAHELKNSLTPIRLTMEEMRARGAERDPAFLDQAAQIVVDEVDSLERRVRAFSEFAAEPPVALRSINVNCLLEERVAFLKKAHPEVTYEVQLAPEDVKAYADEDLVKGILTNLLENAAEAAGEKGRILAATSTHNGHVRIEVHDSGPGLSELAQQSLFQPTISFKKQGMGLGLSIARKSALLNGGDIEPVPGELGGAGFRIQLPCLPNAS
jgi:two-component system nitrogen regulation sensor histidine kinase NtrY